jgi:hypothetical protein
MRRSLYGAAWVLVLGGVLAGCDNVDESLPTAPTPAPTVTETLSGSITVNGAETKTFITVSPGSVTATLKTAEIQVGEGEEPDTTAVTVGLSLGTWNGTSCQLVISNTAAVVGSFVIGKVSGTGALCILVQDVGKLTKPINFSVDVIHP